MIWTRRLQRLVVAACLAMPATGAAQGALPCPPGMLCLRDHRFAVLVTWTNLLGVTGTAASAITDTIATKAGPFRKR